MKCAREKMRWCLLVFVPVAFCTSFDVNRTKANGFGAKILSKRFAQMGVPTPTLPRAYVCVPTGLCISTLNNTYTIDPRADFNVGLCPVGQEPCFGGQSQFPCGIRHISSYNTADGSSTLGAHPWLAYLVNQTSFTGGGVLIGQYYVLTAAHKVYLNVNTPANIRVYMGVWDPSRMTGTQNFTAARIVIHPNFNLDVLRNDVAIVKLAGPVVIGLQINVGTACLPEPNFSYVGRTCVVSGWGQSSFGALDAPRNGQYQVSVPIVDYTTCRTSMSQPHILGIAADRFLDGLGELCAGGRAQVDACTQDGGSPLICQSETTGRFFVAGLVAWGKRCGEPGVFGVYVNVPYYVKWVADTIAALDSGF